ncbi:MAG TPA: GAF domain-containing SpoIIE family protein phosphatase [Bryocella sp.]|nr:GAF domain-containing SpoIIE family protein phosphatase [Bryocella sp.]
MATSFETLSPAFPTSIECSCEFIQALMNVQRAAQLITSTLDLDRVLDRVVNDLASTIGSVEVNVWLREPGTDELILSGVHGCSVHRKGARMKLGTRGMAAYVAATGAMRYAPDVRLDPYYLRCEPETMSAVYIPLVSCGEVIGVFAVDHSELNGFTGDQLHILQALTGHITVAIENARLFSEQRLLHQRMQREAQEAREIQQALIPKSSPLIPGFRFDSAWKPAGVVAGDWFDWIPLSSGRLGIVLADVSGKGMPAALLMSATRATLRTLARLNLSPEETLKQLNHMLIADMPANKFVTLVYGVLDPDSREITFASAGHPRPLLVNGSCDFLPLDTGLPLGLAPSSYPEYTVHLKPGTKVLLYSDGITEAMNRDEEEYGPARLVEHFIRPEACVEALFEEIQRFSVGSEYTDDATAVLITSR